MRLHPDEAAVEETKSKTVDRQAITIKNRNVYPFIFVARTRVASSLSRKRDSQQVVYKT